MGIAGCSENQEARQFGSYSQAEVESFVIEDANRGCRASNEGSKT
ncbi:MAG: hypothetical protein R3C03_21380 [Pirellulaceae bacterium]